MKKILLWILVLGAIAFFVWLFGEKPKEVQAQYGNEHLKNIYEKSVTIVVDNANGYNTGVIPLTLNSAYGGFGSAWGSFCAWVDVDTLAKSGTSAQDSLTIYYKELVSYTSSSSYSVSDYDSTLLIGNFDWANATIGKASLTPDVCYGFEFGVKHNTTVDDSIQVVIKILYQ